MSTKLVFRESVDRAYEVSSYEGDYQGFEVELGLAVKRAEQDRLAMGSSSVRRYFKDIVFIVDRFSVEFFTPLYDPDNDSVEEIIFE